MIETSVSTSSSSIPSQIPSSWFNTDGVYFEEEMERDNSNNPNNNNHNNSNNKNNNIDSNPHSHTTDRNDQTNIEKRLSIIGKYLGRTSSTWVSIPQSLLKENQVQDFSEFIPMEILGQIFSYLDIQSLARCSQVSKRWRWIIDQDPFCFKLWKTIVLQKQWPLQTTPCCSFFQASSLQPLSLPSHSHSHSHSQSLSHSLHPSATTTTTTTSSFNQFYLKRSDKTTSFSVSHHPYQYKHQPYCLASKISHDKQCLLQPFLTCFYPQPTSEQFKSCVAYHFEIQTKWIRGECFSTPIVPLSEDELWEETLLEEQTIINESNLNLKYIPFQRIPNSLQALTSSPTFNVKSKPQTKEFINIGLPNCMLKLDTTTWGQVLDTF